MGPAVLRLFLVSLWTWTCVLSAVPQEKLKHYRSPYVRGEGLVKPHEQQGGYVFNSKLYPKIPVGIVGGEGLVKPHEQQGGYVFNSKLYPKIPHRIVVGHDWRQFFQNIHNQRGAQPNSQRPPGGGSGSGRRRCQLCGGGRHSQGSRTNVPVAPEKPWWPPQGPPTARQGSASQSHPSAGSPPRYKPLHFNWQKFSGKKQSSGKSPQEQNYQRKVYNHQLQFDSFSGSQREGRKTQDDYQRPKHGYQSSWSEPSYQSGQSQENKQSGNSQEQIYQRKINNHYLQFDSFSDSQEEGKQAQDDYQGPNRRYQSSSKPGYQSRQSQENEQSGEWQTSYSGGHQGSNQQPSKPSNSKQSVSFSQKSPDGAKNPEKLPPRQTNSHVRYHTYQVYPHSKPQNEGKTSQWVHVRPPKQVMLPKESEQPTTSGSAKYYRLPSRFALEKFHSMTKQSATHNQEGSQDGKSQRNSGFQHQQAPSKTKERRYWAKKIPDEKIITLPPLGSDSIASSAVFSKRKENVGPSQRSPEGYYSKPQRYTNTVYVYKHPHGQAPQDFQPRGYRWQ